MPDVNPLAHSFYLREIEALARPWQRRLPRWTVAATALVCVIAGQLAARGLLG
jgi:negative regulator of sigma E activity